MFPFFGSSAPPIEVKPPFVGLVELDDYLMSLNQLPKDLSIQLSKSGSNTIGGPKLSLDLGIGINDYVYMSENAKKEARARYGSYNPTLRVNALSEVESNVLVNYITSEGMQTLLASQRGLRVAYNKLKSDNSTIETPQSFMRMNVRGETKPSTPRYEVPLFAYEITFVDQNGEVRDMPYEIKCRGSFNFYEAYQLTNGGLNVTQMSVAREFKEVGVADTPASQMDAVTGANAFNFPKEFASGNMLSNSYYHLLYQWGDLLRGTAEITVQTPQAITGTDWSAERIRSYDRIFNKNKDIEFATIKTATSSQILFRANYKLDATNPEVFKIIIPIHVVPLPNHLVMTQDGVKSRWEMENDVNNLADHQKVEMNLRLARPRSSEIWSNADFNDDFIISYDEYISPEGVAARRAGRAGASPVPNTQLIFSPDPTNSWLSAKKTYKSTSNISGFLNITLPPGRWTISRVSGDRLTKVEPSHEGAKRFEELSLIQQGVLLEEYGDNAPSFSYAPNTVPMAKLSVPAAFYWRETDEYDTTPAAMIGAKMIQDMTSASQDVLTSFELRDSVPPLLQGQPATTDTIYQKLNSMYPNTDKTGYPVLGNGTTATSRQVFDTAVMFFKEDSPYDLSQIGMYEKQLESDFDSSVQGFRDVEVPVVNGTVDYNGYEIKRVIVDATAFTDEETENNFPPNRNWSGFSPQNWPLTYLSDNRIQSTQGNYVESSPGEDTIYNFSIPFLSQHRSDGRSFEALVYYKPHVRNDFESIISLYGIKNGSVVQDRVDAQIEERENSGGDVPTWWYGLKNGLEAVHMWSTPENAIIAGQFILLQAPTYRNEYAGVEEMVLQGQTEEEAMIKAIRQIDLNGAPYFPAGSTNTEIHQHYYPEQSREFNLSQTFPGSLVMFGADVFPSQLRIFPVGFALDFQSSSQGTQGVFLGNAQANVDFVQDMGTLVAPQPYSGEDDEYNMGWGIL